MNLEYDLIIVGGGVTGGILAALMADSGLGIAIIEATKPDPNHPDPRVFAITRASEQIFRSAGIWESLSKHPMGHFREMEVWDANGSGSIHFDSKDLCEPTLGHIIENQSIRNTLSNRIHQQKSIHWLCPETIEHLERKRDHADVVLASGERLKTRLIVGADGFNSLVRDLSEIELKSRDYGQTALVCSVKTQVAHNDVARQRFLTSGPLAFLPLADPHLCSIVWSTIPEQAQTLREMPEKDFHARLEEAFESRLGRVLETGQRYTFPLLRAHARNYVSDRIALIGDAAHRVHPLAGQGANLGFLDAAALAEILLAHKDRDIGKKILLRKYERWRKGNNLAMLIAMDSFKTLFGSTLKPVQWLRNRGLELTDSFKPAKQLIMRRAMGLEGDLPELARTPDFL